MGCPQGQPTTDAYVKHFGDRMRLSVNQLVKGRDGLFMPACLLHTGMFVHIPFSMPGVM
jgi:hypothetical protein